jgi:hypothetical protein
MTHYVKIAGAWKLVDQPYVNVGGVWKATNQSFVKIGGVWKSLSVAVPDLIGLSPAAADAALTAAQLTKGTASSGYTSSLALDNKVGVQSIAAGTLVTPGTVVDYTYTTYLATPATPTITYQGATGKFTITNYNAAYLYEVTAGSVVGNTLTLPSATSTASVKARSFVGGDWSGSQAYSNHYADMTPDTRYCNPTGTYCCASSQYCHCGTGAPCDSQSWGQCGCPAEMCWYGSYCTQNCTSYDCGGSAPALIDQPGYTWSGTEWYKYS